MVRRIAVIGGTDSLNDSLRAAARRRNVEVLAMAPDADLPPGTAAVIAGEDAAEAALDAAAAIGDWSDHVLDLLAESIDCREAFFMGSSLRVKEHATRFARALGLSSADQSILERGACVRDVGKIKIPNGVLLKEGVLNYDEWVLLQQHPEIGAEIVRQLPGLRDVVAVVRHHHECYDGDGYPQGLEGDQIPYLARAMKIIDVYCAMTSPRHYRAEHSTHEDTIEYLNSERGKHYDPDLLDVFVAREVGQPYPFTTLNANGTQNSKSKTDN